MSWFQRLFVTAYFACLSLYTFCAVFVVQEFGSPSTYAFVWAASYSAVLLLLALPAFRIILRDLRRRTELTAAQKRGWACLILLYWPVGLVYLACYGWSDTHRQADPFQ